MNICPQMCMFLERWPPSIIFIIVFFLSYDNHSYRILKIPQKLDNHMPPKKHFCVNFWGSHLAQLSLWYQCSEENTQKHTY